MDSKNLQNKRSGNYIGPMDDVYTHPFRLLLGLIAELEVDQRCYTNKLASIEQLTCWKELKELRLSFLEREVCCGICVEDTAGANTKHWD